MSFGESVSSSSEDAAVRVLSHLLGRRELRALLRSDPLRCAEIVGAQGQTREMLFALDPERLESQATALLNKRLHHVEQLLPRTAKALGNRLTEVFVEYADRSWPTGHRRHLEDASAFCSHLNRWSYPVDPQEHRRLRFASNDRRVSVGLSRRLQTSRGPRPGLHVLLRCHGRIIERAVVIG